MEWIKIMNVESELMLTDNKRQFNIIVDDNTFISGEYICQNLVCNYYNWMYPLYGSSDNINILITMWKKYVNEWQHSIDVMYHALYADYELLNNYNMVENESIGRKIDKTVTTPTATTTQNYQSTTFDNADLRDVDKTTNTTTGTTTVTPSNSQNIDKLGNGYNSGDERILTRSGNIGVTTSQQMIQSELELRKQSVANWILEMFVRQYMYMCDYECFT